MITSLLLWFLLTAFIYIIGHGCSKLLETKKIIANPGVELKFVLGFFFISIVLYLGLFKEIIFLILFFSIALFFRSLNIEKIKKDFKVFHTKKGILAALALSTYAIILLVSSADLVRDYDAYLYHLQSIHWLSTNPLSIGLVNLHQRLAFQSIWFNWSSFFGLEIIYGYPLSYLNSWIFLILFCWLIKLFLIEKNRLVSLVYLIFPALILVIASDGPLFRILRGYNPDVPAIAISIFIFLLILKRQSNFTWFFTILLSSIIGIWLKISLLPLCAISFVYFLIYFKRKSFSVSQIKLSFAVVAVFIVMYLSFNFFKSGNVLYPLSITHTQISWSEEKSETKYLNSVISNWAKRQIRGEELGILGWVIPWHNSLSISEKNLLLISVIFFMGIVVRAVVEKKIRYLEVSLVLGLMLSYWFLLAPDFRFGLGAILGTILNGLVILMASKTNAVFKLFFLLFVVVSIFCTNQSLINYPAWAKMVPQITPWGLQHYPTRSIEVNSKEYFVPELENEDRTNYKDFPSAPSIDLCLNQTKYGPILIFNQKCG